MLWRLENGELEHIRPKVSRAYVGSESTLSLPLYHCFLPLFPQIVVVWVGTNNHGHTAEQVTGGIKAIVELVNQRQPQARVVVLVRGWEVRGERMAVVRDPLRCSCSWFWAAWRQSSGFQAKAHVEACYTPSGSSYGHIQGPVSLFCPRNC